MKLAIETFNLRERFGDKKAIEMISEAGFDAIDYSFYWGKNEHDMLSDNYKEIASELKNTLKKNNILCVQAHAPFNWNPEDRCDFSSENYKKIVRSIEFAAILGAENIIVHSIPAYDKKNNFEQTNLAFYSSLAPYCEKFGIHIAVENLFNVDHETQIVTGKIGTAKELTAFIKKLNSPWFVACLDVDHANITGTPPQNFIRQMNKETLKALHIHDVDAKHDLHTLPYLAELDWDEIAVALSDIGYNGHFTLETIGFFRNFDDELIPYALKFAEQTARHIMNKIK